ncbi:MAG: hypothetical protein M1370_11735 [Bacteroidetes bacterium]|nr:hypothetical protein [Bacteroidota bacterium]MCL5025969.1 hypothetical protein [Chloroflexota bacterium]
MPECGCPDIDDDEWQLKEHNWQGKAFYVVPTMTLLHIPVGMANSIQQMMREVKEKGYRLVEPARILSRDGLFRADVMVEIEPPSQPDPRVKTFGGGRLLSIVHPGPWKRLGTGAAELMRQTRQKPRAMYFWYVACPECRKIRGEKTVIFAYYGEG